MIKQWNLKLKGQSKFDEFGFVALSAVIFIFILAIFL